MAADAQPAGYLKIGGEFSLRSIVTQRSLVAQQLRPVHVRRIAFRQRAGGFPARPRARSMNPQDAPITFRRTTSNTSARSFRTTTRSKDRLDAESRPALRPAAADLRSGRTASRRSSSTAGQSTVRVPSAPPGLLPSPATRVSGSGIILVRQEQLRGRALGSGVGRSPGYGTDGGGAAVRWAPSTAAALPPNTRAQTANRQPFSRSGRRFTHPWKSLTNPYGEPARRVAVSV